MSMRRMSGGGPGEISRIGNTYYAQKFYTAVARAAGRGCGIERAHAQMRMRCTNGIGYLLPKRIEMRGNFARDIVRPSVEWIPRDFLRQCEQNGDFGRISMGMRRKTDNALRSENATQ